MPSKTPSKLGALSRKRGELLEKFTLIRLRELGCMVERIATPTVFVRGQVRRTAKVFADIIGLNSDGKGLLVECKNYGRRPRPSDFTPEQRATLLEWTKRGGVALVAWVSDGEFHIDPAQYILENNLRASKAANKKQ